VTVRAGEAPAGGAPRWAWGLPVAAALLAAWVWSDGMTYAQFHVAFTLPWLALLAWDAWRGRRDPRSARHGALAVAVLVVVAVAYTFPWDRYLIVQGVWGYPDGRVLATIAGVPVEEVAFFVIQTCASGLAALALRRRLRADPPPAPRVAVAARALPAALALGLAALGLLLLPSDAGTYLGLILVWAMPVLALQWGFGGDLLWARRRTFAWAVALPTVWLWVADRLAIGAGIWWISPERTLGWAPLGLPIEEAAFFLVTNLLVVGGVLLAVDGRSLARLAAVVAETRARPWRPLLAVWALAMVPTPLVPDAFVPLAYASTAALAAAVLAVALARFGRRAWVLLGTALTFGWAVEVLGSRTGWPFGPYDYTAAGPALAGVPLLVPIGWFAFALIALAVVPGRRAWWGAPLALVAWDLGLDPLMVREGFWAFAHPNYFGVAWTNFVGWYVAGLALVALLTWIEPRLRSAPGASAPVAAASADLRATYLAQAFLIGVGLAFFGLPLAGAVATGAMVAVWAWGRPGSGV
jgi:lycopene beta-cyclase